jgi:sporulation protein YlmC with PRC-barrel domain
MTQAQGRRVWAVLELLDHQIVDPDGRMVGKVDDLEIELPDPAAGPDALPVVTAIFTGPGALAGHVGGSIGRWLEAVERRINEPGANPSRIGFSTVKAIGSAVEISLRREGLESNRGERWVRDVIISKIPGAGRETD